MNRGAGGASRMVAGWVLTRLPVGVVQSAVPSGVQSVGPAFAVADVVVGDAERRQVVEGGLAAVTPLHGVVGLCRGGGAGAAREAAGAVAQVQMQAHLARWDAVGAPYGGDHSRVRVHEYAMESGGRRKEPARDIGGDLAVAVKVGRR